MSVVAPAHQYEPIGSFRHEALMYRGEDGFLAGTLPFLRDAVEAGDPTLVVVSAAKIDMLRSALGRDHAAVYFSDMAGVGANPARIIPAWRDFVEQNAGADACLRGIGEPIWLGRTPAELAECQRHESLLNVAFAHDEPWWLLCPYDADALPVAVISEAERSHPFVMHGHTQRASGGYRGLDGSAAPFDSPLPPPPAAPLEMAFAAGSLHEMRRIVSDKAVAASLVPARADDLILAVNELATNSLRYGGGHGVLRIWQEPGALICEVDDEGHIHDPLVGRVRPDTEEYGGRGMWLVNQLCDLVQLRSFPTGTVARLHMWLD